MNCAVCGGSLEGKRRDAKYCSTACTRKAPGRMASQRSYRKQTGNACTKKYEKTPKGFLMRAYRNALSRVSGVQKKKAHLYAGLPIMSREDFYGWSWNDLAFWRLYRTWKDMGYPQSLSPSLNRIDPTRGYVRDNVEWVTQSVNSALARKPSREAVTQALKRVLHDATEKHRVA